MKISLALGLALPLGTFALMGVPNSAHAINANHSGTICKNYNAAEAKDIDYLPSGARNLNSNTRFVICPLVTAGNSSATTTGVFVDGFASSGQTISCTLYSYNYQGNFLGSKSFSSPMTGRFDVYLTVPVNYWGGLSVLCSLPPAAQGIIYDVDVVQ